MTNVSRLWLMKAELKYLMLTFADAKVVVLKKGCAVLDLYIDGSIKNSFSRLQGHVKLCEFLFFVHNSKDHIGSSGGT